MSKKPDYTQSAFILAILVVAMMLATNLIPGFKIGKTAFKRINIISDIVKQEDTSALLEADPYFDTTFLAESTSPVSEQQFKNSERMPTAKSQDWQISSSALSTSSPSALIILPEKHSKKQLPAEMTTPDIIELEDFSDDKKSLDKLYASLLHTDKGRATRIAIMGDSFIEGDIITADIREQMQSIYSGRGVGFIPFSSPISKYRGTTKHTFIGWNTYNVIQKRSAPANIKDKFFVSGMVCIPDEGAKTRIQGVTFRKHIKNCGLARILFINEKNSTINVMVNDSIKRVFTPESTPYVQQINIKAEIGTLDITIENVDGFIGYGVVLEEQSGVSVDNYSIRGNSGMALFGTDISINRQINNILGYDLIVLQYGLNAMAPNVSNYNTYSSQLVKIIDHIKKCFPESAILVMSVGDRSTLRDGELVTMPAVHAMIAAQREAAQKTGVIFWNMFLAMGGENSMVEFVKRNWAAKDYTHIGYAGGKYIGREFVRSLIRGVVNQPESVEQTFSPPSFKPQIDSFK